MKWICFGFKHTNVTSRLLVCSPCRHVLTLIVNSDLLYSLMFAKYLTIYSRSVIIITVINFID